MHPAPKSTDTCRNILVQASSKIQPILYLKQTKKMDEKSIRSILITETECIVTVNYPETKHIHLPRGNNLKNRYIKIFDVEKKVTNMTITHDPCEMSNMTICGEVVQVSMKRNTIKETNTETGTCYVQLTNCVPVIPNTTKFGRLDMRLFHNNNRTECLYCSKTNHPPTNASNSLHVEFHQNVIAIDATV